MERGFVVHSLNPKQLDRFRCKIRFHLTANPAHLTASPIALDRGCRACPGGDWRRIGLPDSERVLSDDTVGLKHPHGVYQAA